MRAPKALFLSVAFTLACGLACNKEKPQAPEDKASAESKKSDGDEKKPGKKKGDDDGKEPAKNDDGDKKADGDDKKKGGADKKKGEAAPPKKEKLASDKIAAYWAAMSEGRKATLAKKYGDAYAAFDKALKVLPDDARAVSERGYAKLLAKDYKGAVADLDKAVVRTSDKKLLGQIYYNYGLAAEGEGDAEAARAAFARSNTYNPTPAAKKKLDGKSTCTAVIDHKPPTDHKTFASWKEAYESIRTDNEDLEKWESEAVSLNKGFCTNKWKKGDACVAVVHAFMMHTLYILVPTKEGKVVTFDLDMVGGRCGGEVTAQLVSDEGDVTHAHWKSNQGVGIYVTEKNGEIVPCGEKDTECSMACGSEAESFGDLFVDKVSGDPMLFVGREEDGGKDPLKITVEMPTVTIKGKGCDAERPLAK